MAATPKHKTKAEVKLYLTPDVRRALRMKSASDGESMSTIVERSLRAVLKMPEAKHS